MMSHRPCRSTSTYCNSIHAADVSKNKITAILFSSFCTRNVILHTQLIKVTSYDHSLNTPIDFVINTNRWLNIHTQIAPYIWVFGALWIQYDIYSCCLGRCIFLTTTVFFQFHFVSCFCCSYKFFLNYSLRSVYVCTSKLCMSICERFRVFLVFISVFMSPPATHVQLVLFCSLSSIQLRVFNKIW